MINDNSPSYFNYTNTAIKENKFSIGINNNSKDFFNYTDRIINIPEFTQQSMAYRNESLINPLDILTNEESIYYDVRELNSALSDVVTAIPSLQKLEALPITKIDYFNTITNMVLEVISFAFNMTTSLNNLQLTMGDTKGGTSGSGLKSESGDIGALVNNIINLLDGVSTLASTIISHKETMKHYDSLIDNLNKQIDALDKDLKVAKETYDTLYKPNRMFRSKSTSTLMKR